MVGFEFTVMVNVFDVALVVVKQPAEVVMLQYTVFPFTNEDEEYVFEAPL